jgi:hypothetical protein
LFRLSRGKKHVVSWTAKSLRGDADAVSDWVILVEGYDREASEQVMAELAGDAGLVEHGADPGHSASLFSLDYVIDETEAKKVWKPA